MPAGEAQRRQKSTSALLARLPSREVGGDRGCDRKRRIDRREPVGLDAGMQRMPDEIGDDGPERRVDQHARGGRAGVAPQQRIKPHRAEDEHQRRCECDLGRDQLADEGRPEILDPGAAELLDEGDPLVIGVPENDRREDQKRNDAAEIRPGRDQPAPQFRHRHQPDQDRRTEKQRGVFRQQRSADRDADREPPRAASGLQYLGEKKQHEARGHQQRRIRRHDQGADRRHQRDVEQDGRGRRHPHAAEQDGGGAIHRTAHRQRQQDRHQPHAEFGVARDHGAETDHQRDAGG